MSLQRTSCRLSGQPGRPPRLAAIRGPGPPIRGLAPAPPRRPDSLQRRSRRPERTPVREFDVSWYAFPFDRDLERLFEQAIGMPMTNSSLLLNTDIRGDRQSACAARLSVAAG